MRHFAARHVVYLILRAVGTLTPATNPSNALGFATAEMTAAMGNWTSEDELGGYYWKVVRWTYEKQGLFQPPGAPIPVTTEGAPPPVDVFIDDGRHGEYQYGPQHQFPWLQRFWETTDIWNRLEPDGHAEHQTPIIHRTNYAYVRVHNRGTQTATSVLVRGYHCRPTAGLVWPDDWSPMATASLPVSAGIPPGGGHRRALVRAFRKRRFWARNPLHSSAKMEIRSVLPTFLLSRGWAMIFDNPGGGSFTLGAHDARVIRPRLIGGQSFTASDVTVAAPVEIRIVVLANGLVVGGLTFTLDPKLKHPPREEIEEEHERHEEPEPHENHHDYGHHKEHREDDRRRRVRVDVDVN